MNPAIVIAPLLALIASAPAAQTIPVRSGEHDTFSRLVMTVPAGMEWSIERSGRAAEIRLAMPEARFDTQRVFHFIPKTRLAALSQPGDGGVLQLALACDCNVVGFVLSDTLLVVDIQDQAPPQPAQPFYLTPQAAYRFSASPRIVGLGNLRLPVPMEMRDRAAHADTTRVEAPAEAPPGPDPGINISERRLLDQIGRAAEQGLLTPLLPVAAARDAPQADTASAGVSAPALPEQASVSVLAATVIDRDMSRVSGALAHIEKARECLPSDLLAVRDWGGDGEFTVRIGRLRSALYKEFDRLDPDSAAALAKTYLHYGFGAEAREAVKLVPEGLEHREILLALADIVDGPTPTAPTPFAGQQNCDGDTAMWSVLSRPDLAWDANTDAVMQAFARLPLHLRTHLGPRLSRIFAEVDELELAAALLRKIDLAEDTPGPDQDFAAAAIEKSRGETETAVEKMSEVVQSDSEYSPQALVELVDTHWRERMPIPADLPLLAAAYAAEHRKTELGPDLRRTHALALALAGAFDPAFAAHADLARRDGPEPARQALPPLMHLLAENADDVTFLKFGLSVAGDPAADLPTEIEDKLARRMLDLGFPEPAVSLLSTAGVQPASSARRLMRAEAALAMDLPHRALVDLLSVSGPEAARLRAEAMARNGDHGLSGQVLMDADMAAEAARGLWLGESWQGIADDRESPYGRMAEMSLRLLSRTEDQMPETPLARARALLDDSRFARGKIGDLLDVARQARAGD